MLQAAEGTAKRGALAHASYSLALLDYTSTSFLRLCCKHAAGQLPGIPSGPQREWFHVLTTIGKAVAEGPAQLPSAQPGSVRSLSRVTSRLMAPRS
jgi:hypothetical protein